MDSCTLGCSITYIWCYKTTPAGERLRGWLVVLLTYYAYFQPLKG